MVKLSRPLLPNQVARMKGVLDYYVTKGVPIVRSWPSRIIRPQRPGERNAQCHMLQSLKVYRCSPGWWVDQMRARLQGYSWSRRDYMFSYYLNPPGYNNLPGQGHHPPQPTECPGGDGHYFALLDSWAVETGFFNKRLFWVFDRPLNFFLSFIRYNPTPLDLLTTRQGIVHHQAAIVRPDELGLRRQRLFHAGGTRYMMEFSQLGMSTDVGDWYAYISAEHPVTNHPAISLTPWFHFSIPFREGPPAYRPASGITLISNDYFHDYDPRSSTRVPRDPLDYADCVFDSVDNPVEV